MSKIRIYQLAKQLNISSAEVIDILKTLGVAAKSHQSSIEDESAKLVQNIINDQKNPKETPKPETVKEAEVPVEEKIEEPAVPEKVLTLDANNITVKELSDKLEIRVSDIIKELMILGVLATINQRIDLNIIEKVCEKFGITLKHGAGPESAELDLSKYETPEDAPNLKPRPPVVTIMGHVDHGKTKLLDAIRKSNIMDKEAGGITQHIGAYQVNVHGKLVTFLDTPGHEAFTTLRARGAKATDIAILVVAADDGIMPQTLEAIDHARAANVPIIVAINKIDKPEANIDRVKQQLVENGLVPEDWGGTTVTCSISAKSVIGIDQLLEMILLVAEVAELKANNVGPATGIIIESKLDKSKGPVATVLIKKGTLTIGDSFVVGSTSGKVRAMFDDFGKRVKFAGPAAPVEVIGISNVPQAGTTLQVVPDEKAARIIAQKIQEKLDIERLSKGKVISLQTFSENIAQGNEKSLNLIVKADVHGSLEAINQSVGGLAHKDAKVNIIHTGTGSITESDVMLAKASEAIVIGFNIPLLGAIKELAEKEGVDIHLFNIIYNLIDSIRNAMEGLILPEFEEVVVGLCEIRNLFSSSKVGTILGCFVVDGKMVRGFDIRLFRDKKMIFQGKLDSLKRFKDDAKEVLAGFECGCVINNFSDFAVNDIIEAFEIREKPRKL